MSLCLNEKATEQQTEVNGSESLDPHIFLKHVTSIMKVNRMNCKIQNKSD